MNTTKLRLRGLLLFAILSILVNSAVAVPITFTWNTSGAQVNPFDPFVSLTGSFTLDSSLFDPSNAHQGILFKTSTMTNLSQFHFVLVADVGGIDQSYVFDLPDVNINAGASFDSTTNPPTYIDGTGQTALNSTGANIEFFQGQIGFDSGSGFGEQVFGSFTAKAVAGVPDTGSTAILLSVSMAALIGLRRKRLLPA